MQASTRYFSTSTLACYFLDSFEDGFGLKDGEFVVYWQAYDPITNKPVGPWHGDVNPAYVRLWMAEKHPDAIEVEIISIPTVEVTAVAR